MTDLGFTFKALGDSFANCKLEWSQASIADITGTSHNLGASYSPSAIAGSSIDSDYSRQT